MDGRCAFPLRFLHKRFVPGFSFWKIDDSHSAQSSRVRGFRAACKDYRLRQEFVTPYTPEQNSLIKRWFRSIKEKCVWLQNFPSFEEAKSAVRSWIDGYNNKRPHRSLDYKVPGNFIPNN